MKKFVLITAAALATCVSSYGQGFFNFANSGPTAAYENFSNGTFQKSSATAFVTLLFSTDTAAVPLIGGSSTPTGSTAAVSWATVTADPNFHVAQQTGTNISAATRSGISVGTFAGGATGIDGTSAGQTVKMYVVGWDLSEGRGAYGTANYLGWSNPFLITLVASNGTLSSLNGAGMTAFGLQAVPEPGTFALAGLSAAAMLIFRRRK